MNAKNILLAIVAILVVGSIAFFESQKIEMSGSEAAAEEIEVMGKDEKVKLYEPAKEITTPDGFINIPEIMIAGEIGKNVVLVDFWTYSCINCQRTFPYLRAWHEKYGDKGLTIIGVHTPEFEFEKDYANVLAATKKFSITYPVVLDNDYSTWRAYKNQYWPRKYLIDIDGFIVYDHIGEGGYEETERKIQELLEERSAVLGIEDGIADDIAKPEAEERGDVRTPEIYFGSLRSEPNQFSLEGEWDITPEFARNVSGDAIIRMMYHAKDVYFVASAEQAISITVRRDGKIVSAERGSDVKSDGTVTISDDRLYRLIEGTDYGPHLLEITIPNPGLKAFTFTFG